MEETSNIRLLRTKHLLEIKIFQALMKSLSGKWPTKFFQDLKLSIKITSSIAISRALIFFLSKVSPNLGTLTFPKSLTTVSVQLKPVLLTIQALKYGREKSTTVSAIFGHWDALSMKWQHWGHPSKLMIFLPCIEIFYLESILKFLLTFLKIWNSLSECV